MKTEEFSQGISLKNIQVTDSFLGERMETVRREVIPYQWAALNDEVEGAEPSFCMRNFKLAAKLGERRRSEGQEALPVWSTEPFQLVPEDKDAMEERFYGFVFQDTDFSKWIEAVGYSLANHPDSQLEQLADAAIDVVCGAQYEDGYLDTFYIINDPSKRLSNLRDHHELYCFGHLTEGAIAYYEATGKDKLLKAAMRFADYVELHFGKEENKSQGYPGHEIAEMALGRLYETTGEEKYLALAQYFIEERGQKPYYFDKEHHVIRKSKEEDYQYHQAHRPVRQQDEAVGHAVRAVYLYTAMAQVAKYTGDESLQRACETLWESIEKRKMYITGGIGATPEGEAFSYNYHLPNDRMYNETCASIGLMFFARRMLEMSPESRYADVMERALYNGVMSGMAQDGKSFFYVNPMEAEPEGCRQDAHRKHVALPRQKWFGCACCPPNICRLLSSVAQYAYSEKEDTILMHLYCGATIQKCIRGVDVSLEIKSEYPWKENVQVVVSAKEETEFTYALRVPGWCSDFSVTINGKAVEMCNDNVKNGYLYLSRTWCDGDEVRIHMGMPPVYYQADTRVRDDIGKVVLMRGPLVYCVEEADNGDRLDMLEVDPMADVKVCEATEDMRKDMGNVVVLKGKGRRIKPRQGENLYQAYAPYEYQATEITFIPYYAWCNRGVGEMKTYLSVMPEKA